MTPERARRLGWATFAAFLLAIVGSWHGLAFLKHPLSHSLNGATGLWLLIDLAGAILGCGLAVLYLRHVYRGPSGPGNRTTWALLILMLGPFVMPLYWWLHMRRVPTSPAHLVQTGLITEEEARLLARVSGQGGGLGVAYEEARAVRGEETPGPEGPAGAQQEQAVTVTSVPPPAPRAAG